VTERPITPLTALVLGLLLLAVAGACSSAEEQEAADWDGVENALEEYLPRLAEAYTSGDVSVLEGLAAPKEMARVAKRIDEFAALGRVLEPEFVELKVEKVDVWGYANAFVNTVEIWDLRSYATGSHEIVGEELAQSNRVKYQFKREGDQWLVLYRTISD
jgi:hypothetical protein